MAELTKEIIDFVQRQVKYGWDEDIAQDLYIEIMEHPDESIGTGWVYQKYQWMWRDRARKEKRRLEILDEIGEQAANMRGPDEYADDPMDLLEFEEEVRDRLRGMSDTLLRTAEYIYLEGLTPDEAAAKEGIARNAIDQRVHNIKKQLRGEV